MKPATHLPPDPGSDPSGHRERLRQRFLKTGFAGFADYEVVELLLTLCIPRRDVKPQAKRLIQQFGSLRHILDAPPDELQKVKGLGQVAPVALRIIKEAANLYLQQNAEQTDILNSTEKLERFWRMRLGTLSYEVFEVAYLDSAYKLLKDGVERLEHGIVDRAQVYPRKVMEAALRRGAAGLVLAHNHPAGRASPSQPDIDLTRVLAQIAGSLGIRIVDHIILTADATFSFKRAGML
jgi:DNA repair protein RadC